MATDLLEVIAARTDVEKRGDETLKEYLQRVGEVEGLEQERIDAAIGYVSEYQYAREQPQSDAPLRSFLASLGTEPAEADETEKEPASASTADELDVPDFELPESLESIRSGEGGPGQGFKGGLSGREPRLLLLWFVLMVATTPILGYVMSRTWVPGHVAYEGVADALGLLGLGRVEALELAGIVGLGLYVGLLALFILDVKKRVQGMLLLVGSVLAIVAMAAGGVFLPNIDVFSPLNAIGLVFGLLVGLSIEFEQLRSIDWGDTSFRRPTVYEGDVAEFRYAAYVLFGLLVVIVLATLGQALAAGVIEIWDPVAGAVFLIMAYRFISYESETHYVALGPARAGKSMLMVGLCLELLAANGPHPRPNDYLQNGLERVSNLQPGRERWPIPSTAPEILEIASFEIIAGYYFPRRLEITAPDYAGQHLQRVAELFETESITGENPDSDPSESIPATVAQSTAGSDTILLLLDVERLVHPDRFQLVDDVDAEEDTISWGLEYYASILEHLDPDDVVIVATKCDILVHDGAIDPPGTFDDYDSFANAVTEFLGSRPDVQELFALASEDSITPVFFATKQQNGEYVPRLDESGNLMPIGYRHLVETLRARQ